MIRRVHRRRCAGRVRRARSAAWIRWLAGLAWTACSGCVSGSLASNTGPRPEGFAWSTASQQQVHVGETVAFDFVLSDQLGRRVDPTGLADYCMASVGPTQTEAVPDAEGRFRFTHTLTAGVTPGDRMVVRVTAYQRRGSRDFVEVRGRWLESESPFDDPDRVVASDAVTLVVYRTEIDLRLPRPADDFDPETGVLRICRRDGVTTAVYLDRPNRPGFSLDGPGLDGYYHVRYRPRGDEVNAAGSTPVTFDISDRAGIPHTAKATLATP